MMADLRNFFINLNRSFVALDKTEKKRDPYVILVDGIRVRLRSGKYTWNGIGAAKNALNNHICHIWNYDEFKEETKQWVAKHVQFVKYDTWLNSEKWKELAKQQIEKIDQNPELITFEDL